MKPLIIRSVKIPLKTKSIKDMVLFIHQELKKKKLLKTSSKLELTLVFISSQSMRALNRRYRKRDYATDVLSFDSSDPLSLGELIFCWPVILRQSKEHQLNSELEFFYMLVHGVLHLLGFDHEKSKAQAKKMFKVQDQLFASYQEHLITLTHN